MRFVKLEMGLDSFGESKNFLFLERKANNLNANRQSCWVNYALLNHFCHVVIPCAFVSLLILPDCGNWSRSNGHTEDVPDKSVSCQNWAFVWGSMIGRFHTEARADDQVQVLITPKLYPLLSQLLHSSSRTLILVSTQLSRGVYDDSHPGLRGVHYAFRHVEKTAVHRAYKRYILILFHKFFSLQHISKSLEVSFSNELGKHTANSVKLVREFYLYQFVSFLSQEVNSLINCSEAGWRAFDHLKLVKVSNS